MRELGTAMVMLGLLLLAVAGLWWSNAFGRAITVCSSVTGSISVCQLCPGFTVGVKGNARTVRCPGDPALSPFLTINACQKGLLVQPPILTRTASTLTFRCP